MEEARLTSEIIDLVVIYPLNGDDIGLHNGFHERTGRAWCWNPLTYRICRPTTDTGHNGDQHMLLHVERTRIQLHAENRVVRDEFCPGTAHRERDQLSDDLHGDDDGVRESPFVRIDATRDKRTPVTLTAGKRKKKNWFMPGMMTAQISPITHTRSEDAGMPGSSVLATAERTSGYGESSSARRRGGKGSAHMHILLYLHGTHRK